MPDNGTIHQMSAPAQQWTAADLVQGYVERARSKKLRVGIEWERSGIYRDTMHPVPYLGTQGYVAVLQKLVDEVGWQIIEAEEGCGIISIQRGDARVTIEGDGRPELAGSPQASLHDLAREFRIHANEYTEMGNIFNIGWLPLGFQPLHPSSAIELAPRKRYNIFQKLGKAELMEDMTKRTNGLTANVSYKDAAGAVRMAQTAFRVLPVIGAMYASSPLIAGEPSKYLNVRRWCIQNHFPGRTGIPSTILDPNFSLLDWVEYYFDLPVILRKRNGVTEPLIEKKCTFRAWLENGIDGDFPSMEDFDQHVKTTWSDMRLRPSYIEYRMADTARERYVMTLPALMKGLLQDPENWEKIEKLTEGWTYKDIIEGDQRAWKYGLRAKIKGVTLLSVAQQMLLMANESLHEMKELNSASEDESVFLAPLKQRVYIDERSPADEILRLWESEWNRNPRSLLEWCCEE
jgi:glutamate--cysteine ligase